MKRVAIALALTACHTTADEQPSTAASGGAMSPTVAASTSVTPASATATGATASSQAVSEPPTAQLTALSGSTDKLLAKLDGVTFDATVATHDHPRPHRRPLAYYRLSRALGSSAVPTTVVLRTPLGRLSELLSDEARAYLTDRAAVANDGTVMLLLVARHDGRPAGEDDFEKLRKAAARNNGAASKLLTSYVDMLVLDYLSANVLRRGVTFGGDQLWLTDSSGAFPGFVAAKSLDVLLDALRRVVRFPRDLRQRLGEFDRQTARRTLLPGRFEDQLLGPRQLSDLMERRATLLSLLEARALKYGAESAFSLPR